MKTIQITIDEVLLEEVDRIISKVRTNRNAFFRDAVEREIKRRRSAGLEKRPWRGNARQPQTHDAVDERLPENDW